jgi:hypothetical protein
MTDKLVELFEEDAPTKQPPRAPKPSARRKLQ